MVATDHGIAEVALEHLGAFAAPLGVRLLVENLMSEPTTPEHLVTILRLSHLDQVGVCLDLGHAHITVEVAEAIATFGDRIVSVHMHDNHGVKGRPPVAGRRNHRLDGGNFLPESPCRPARRGV